MARLDFIWLLRKRGFVRISGRRSLCTDGHRATHCWRSLAGYRNLCRLITRMKLRAKKGEGAATWEEFAEFAEGCRCV
jgi:error-prone DNA polymerase